MARVGQKHDILTSCLDATGRCRVREMEADLDLLRRQAEALGLEFTSPQVAAKLLNKSIASVRLQGREGKLGDALCFDLGNPTYCYPVARCCDFWGSYYPLLLAELRMASFVFTIEKWGDFENMPVSILHPFPIISKGERTT